MKSKIIGKTEVVEYNSLSEFYDYIMNTPTNESFRFVRLSSMKGSYNFTQTNSFDEAVELFKTGWSSMSEKLEGRLKAEAGNMEMAMISKNIVSVQGYHPIVPLYLNGIPANMVSRKMQPMKQKIITVNKSVSYSAMTSTDEIIKQSVKALAIIRKLENQNYRCNLNIILGTEYVNDGYVIKVRIKSANERLNINKLSFPLVHPSMLRRLFLRFIEVYPNIPPGFTFGYGRPMSPDELRKWCKDEILLPQFINKDIKEINTLEDLEKVDKRR